MNNGFTTWTHLLTGRTVRVPSWMHPALNDWDKPNWRKTDQTTDRINFVSAGAKRKRAAKED